MCAQGDPYCVAVSSHLSHALHVNCVMAGDVPAAGAAWQSYLPGYIAKARHLRSLLVHMCVRVRVCSRGCACTWLCLCVAVLSRLACAIRCNDACPPPSIRAPPLLCAPRAISLLPLAVVTPPPSAWPPRSCGPVRRAHRWQQAGAVASAAASELVRVCTCVLMCVCDCKSRGCRIQPNPAFSRPRLTALSAAGVGVPTLPFTAGAGAAGSSSGGAPTTPRPSLADGVTKLAATTSKRSSRSSYFFRSGGADGSPPNHGSSGGLLSVLEAVAEGGSGSGGSGTEGGGSGGRVSAQRTSLGALGGGSGGSRSVAARRRPHRGAKGFAELLEAKVSGDSVLAVRCMRRALPDCLSVASRGLDACNFVRVGAQT